MSEIRFKNQHGVNMRLKQLPGGRWQAQKRVIFFWVNIKNAVCKREFIGGGMELRSVKYEPIIYATIEDVRTFFSYIEDFNFQVPESEMAKLDALAGKGGE